MATAPTSGGAAHHTAALDALPAASASAADTSQSSTLRNARASHARSGGGGGGAAAARLNRAPARREPRRKNNMSRTAATAATAEITTTTTTTTTIAASEEPKERRVYACEHCGREYQRPEHLSRHRRLHSDVRAYACDECGRRFHRRDHLRSHMDVHSALVQHACPVERCTRVYRQRRSLRHHLFVNHADYLRRRFPDATSTSEGLAAAAAQAAASAVSSGTGAALPATTASTVADVALSAAAGDASGQGYGMFAERRAAGSGPIGEWYAPDGFVLPASGDARLGQMNALDMLRQFSGDPSGLAQLQAGQPDGRAGGNMAHRIVPGAGAGTDGLGGGSTTGPLVESLAAHDLGDGGATLSGTGPLAAPTTYPVDAMAFGRMTQDMELERLVQYLALHSHSMAPGAAPVEYPSFGPGGFHPSMFSHPGVVQQAAQSQVAAQQYSRVTHAYLPTDDLRYHARAHLGAYPGTDMTNAYSAMSSTLLGSSADSGAGAGAPLYDRLNTRNSTLSHGMTSAASPQLDASNSLGSLGGGVFGEPSDLSAASGASAGAQLPFGGLIAAVADRTASACRAGPADLEVLQRQNYAHQLHQAQLGLSAATTQYPVTWMSAMNMMQQRMGTQPDR